MEKGIGIYIGRKEIVAASVLVSKGIPQVRQFAVEPINLENSEENQPKKPNHKNLLPESRAVVRALQKMNVKRAEVIASFSPFHLVTRHFTMPVIPHKEWANAIQFEARRYIPFRLEETLLDQQVVEEKKDDQNHLSVAVSVAKKDVLRAHMNHLKQAGMKVMMLEPVFSALTRALSVTEQFESGKIYGFIFFDSDGSINVTISSDGVVYLSRDFLLSEDQVSNQSRFYQELKVSLDFVRETTGKKEITKIYLAGNGDLVFWSSFLASVFENQISFEVASFPTKKEISKNILGAILVPIGLALRASGLKSPLGDYNLLPPDEKQVKREKIKKVVGIEFLIIAIFFIILRALILEPYAAHTQKQAMRQLSPEAANDIVLANNSIGELQNIKGGLQNRIDQLKDPSKAKSSISKTLNSLAKILPNSVWLDQISYRGGAEASSDPGARNKKLLELSGLCYTGDAEQEVQAINQWVSQALGQDKTIMGNFKTLTLDEVRREKAGGYDATRFKVTIR